MPLFGSSKVTRYRTWLLIIIVKHHHKLGNHKSGANQTLVSLSSRYWIEAAREVIRQGQRECCKCAVLKANSACQLMTTLPKIRLSTLLRAFARIAVDYAGPFVTIKGTSKAIFVFIHVSVVLCSASGKIIWIGYRLF